ncbi:MAG: hypothetical protein SXV54_21085 [Chloroflexota bacterium]|nr:hypothetical protein [Chloroflexota bacterium]
MNDLRVWKAICEVRYPPAASLFDNRGKIASKWQGMYDLTEWRIARNNVIVHNRSETVLFQAGFKNVVFVMELPSRYKDFSEQAINLLSGTLEILEISKLERIGLRIIQLAERKSFKVLMTDMTKKLYRLSDDDWAPFEGPPIDVGMPLTFSLGENRVNFMIGPMHKEQLDGYFTSAETKGQTPSTVLFVDFDLYRKDPKLRKKDFKKSLTEFLKLGESEILPRSTAFVEQFGGFKR